MDTLPSSSQQASFRDWIPPLSFQKRDQKPKIEQGVLVNPVDEVDAAKADALSGITFIPFNIRIHSKERLMYQKLRSQRLMSLA